MGPARKTGSARSPTPLRIGVCGLGTVAGGLVSLLTDEASELGRRAGRELRLTRIASRTEKPHLVPSGVNFSTDVMGLVEDPEIDVIVELIGGVEPALSLIRRALELAKPVVTANKEVLAKHGDALFQKSLDAGVALGFEASVGGGIPIIKSLREGLAGDRVTSIVGIVNGTTNFILSRMAEVECSFEAALSEAQQLGFAEAEPAYDVEGTDAAHKIAIMAAISWGVPFDVDRVEAEGISHIGLPDLAFARRLGYAIKHLGVARRVGRHIETRVYPALVHESNLLAQVQGVTNAVEVRSDSLGRSLYIGPGAGALPTANAVLSDILDIANGTRPRPIPEGSGLFTGARSSESASAYYLHVQVHDKTGVLARLAEVLAAGGISIDALLQPDIAEREQAHMDEASIVLIAHETTDAKMQETVRLIESFPEVRGKASLIRVYEGD